MLDSEHQNSGIQFNNLIRPFKQTATIKHSFTS